MELESLSAYVKLDLLSSQELIKISLQFLDNGCKSSSIACLAGESDISYLKAKNYILEFLKELNKVEPDEFSAKKIVINDVFNKVAKKEINPQQGAKYIIVNIQDSELDGDTIGDYLSIEKMIGYQYQIDDIYDGEFEFNEIEAQIAIEELEKNIISFSKEYLKNQPSN